MSNHTVRRLLAVGVIGAFASVTVGQGPGPISRPTPSGPAAGYTANYGEITISITSPPAGESTHGYREYAVTASNRSNTPRRVELKFPDESRYGSGEHIRAIRCEREIGPEAVVRFSMFQPDRPSLGGWGGGGVEVRIEGLKQEKSIPIVMGDTRRRGGYYGGYSTPALPPATKMRPGLVSPTMSPPTGYESNFVLRGRGVPTQIIQDIHSLGGMRYGMREENFPAHPLPTSEWSPHWLGYSRYDGIIITREEFRQMSDAVKSAIWQYVETGGSLTILGGELVPKTPTNKETPEPGVTVHHAGFGRCLVSETRDPAKWSDKTRHDLIESWTFTAAPWKTQRTVGQANQEFPVVEDSGVPVRGLFLLMVGFVAVIGPLNLMFLSRRNKRIWLLWTVPVISLLTCAMVFGYMLVSEGWNAHARTEVFTLLDENARQATTIGWTAFYSPLTPNDGLHYGQNTEVCPQLLDTHWYQGGGTARTLDWTSDQHLSSGWVTARSPAQFMIRKTETRRERVDITRSENGGLSMMNGLGADIADFCYADTDGKVFVTGPVAAGGIAKLTQDGFVPSGEPIRTDLRFLYAGGVQSGTVEAISTISGLDWLKCADRITKAPKSFLQSGRYIAILNSTPFVEEGLKAKYRKERTIVIGVHKEAGNES